MANGIRFASFPHQNFVLYMVHIILFPQYISHAILICLQGTSYFLLVHIWCYDSFEAMTEAKVKMSGDEEWSTLRKSRSKLLNSRGNQVLMAFTYWQPQFDHLSNKIFELRSYTLKVCSVSPDT